MLVELTSEEWYPVFELSYDRNMFMEPIEIPDDLYHRYKEALLDFKAVQREIGKIISVDQNFWS